MFPLFETIKVQDGVIQNAEYHQKRYEKSYEEHYQKKTSDLLLGAVHIPSKFKNGIVKLKITYSDHSKKYHFSAYQSQSIHKLKTGGNQFY